MAIFVIRKGHGTDGRIDLWTNGRTDGRTWPLLKMRSRLKNQVNDDQKRNRVNWGSYERRMNRLTDRKKNSWQSDKLTHYGTKPGHFETSIIHFPTSEGVSEVSGTSKRANGRARGPVLTFLFLFVPDHSAKWQADGNTNRKIDYLYWVLSFLSSFVGEWLSLGRDSDGIVKVG